MDNISLADASDEVVELASKYAEKYVNYVENLPFDIQRSVTRLREIDLACRDVITEIETLSASFTKDKDISLKGRSTLLQIQRLFAKCQELGDEKIAIVQQLSETVDGRKKQVEHSAYRFKVAYRPDLKDELNGKREFQKSDGKSAKRTRRRRNHHGSDKSMERPEKLFAMDSNPLRTGLFSNGNSSASNKQLLSLSLEPPISPVDEEVTPRRGERTEKKETSSSAASSTTSTVTSTVTSPAMSVASKLSNSSKPITSKPSTSSTRGVITPVSTSASNGGNKAVIKGKKKKRKSVKHYLERNSARSPSPQEMPIDPDEPTYCLCGQVSFGQMIGCDNKKCPIEWFHFSCVGLTHNPKGKWYCPDCLRDRKREAKHR
uniref:Inhibitor of growth protein n=1 Tax=Phallusia mammillata TaxID=59560 RepID=A0A6F9DFT6_9ASCI|nr:inhibitor of growth protein 1 [Phallusia mammillata]